SLPEVEDWLALSQERYPDSCFNRLDAGYVRVFAARDREDHEAVIKEGELWLNARIDYRLGKFGWNEISVSTLTRSNPQDERDIRLVLAGAYLKKGYVTRAYELLKDFPWGGMGDDCIAPALKAVMEIFLNSDLDTGPLLRAFWAALQEKTAKGTFLTLSTAFFEAEPIPGGKAPWEAFIPLKGSCPLGDAAARLARERTLRNAPPELRQLAEQVNAILAKYPPDDPVIIAFKNSEQYQKVAYLLED
ncbi:MAG: hypothetical protein IJU12_02695, partial [Clostridia bacterium]|nr:hypothetical protein [Clostridia bacterium]